MDINRAFQQRVGNIGQNERAEDLNEFAPFARQDGCSEDSIVRRVHNDFHKAASFIALDGASDEAHGNLADFQLVALGTSHLLREADTAKLRVGEHRVRHIAFVG